MLPQSKQKRALLSGAIDQFLKVDISAGTYEMWCNVIFQTISIRGAYLSFIHLYIKGSFLYMKAAVSFSGYSGIVLRREEIINPILT